MSADRRGFIRPGVLVTVAAFALAAIGLVPTPARAVCIQTICLPDLPTFVPPPPPIPPSELSLHPNGCHSLDFYARVDTPTSPPLTVTERRSDSQTFVSAIGKDHAEAHEHTIDVSDPITAHLSVVDSSCDTRVQTEEVFQETHGESDVSQLMVDLSPIGTPMTITADVLDEKGFTAQSPALVKSGGNTADIANVKICVTGPPVAPPGPPKCIYSANYADPNTQIFVPPGLVYVGLNEQWTTIIPGTPGGCRLDYGDALRVVVFNPLAPPGSKLAEVVVSWVWNGVCY